MTTKLSPDKIIKHCDAAEGMADLPADSVDLIFTDPPYQHDICVDCCRILASEAPRILKPGRSLVTLLGHKTIPDVVAILDEALQYRWMFAMLQSEGKHAHLRNAGVEVVWKPALWFSNGPIPADRLWGEMNIMRDGIEMPPTGEGTIKKHHKWEQTKVWSDYYIPRLAFEGETILDPFMGSGNFLLSARETGCSIIGFEKDGDSFSTAKSRLGSVD